MRRGTAGYQAGEHAKRASSNTHIRALKLTRIVVGALTTLPIGLAVGGYRLPLSFDGDPGPLVLSAVCAVGANGLFWWLQRRAARRIEANGSFLYIACQFGNDRDVGRFRRLVIEQAAGAQQGEGIVSFDVADPVQLVLDADDPAGSLCQLVENVRYALRAVDSSIPTNIVANALWPIGVELGRRADLDVGAPARLWYLPDGWSRAPAWHDDYTWLARTLLDVIDLGALPDRHPQRDQLLSAGVPSISLGTDPDPQPERAERELVVVAFSQPLPDDRSRAAFEAMRSNYEPQLVTTVRLKDGNYETGDKGVWLKDPSLMADHAAIAAATIDRACRRCDSVLVAARVTKPESVAIGYLLKHWKTPAAGLTYANYNGPESRYDIWELNAADVTPSSG
jgi:hypothetical protein